MCKEISVNANEISWIYNNKKIIVSAQETFFVTEREGEYIYIECGKDFILEAAYYYDLEGTLKFSFCIPEEYIVIGNGEKLYVNQLKLANFYPCHNVILLLLGEKENKILGYDLNGHLLFEAGNPIGYQMKYFQCNQDKLYVVCEGDSHSIDQYGRFQHNFLIELSNGKLIKDALAY